MAASPKGRPAAAKAGRGSARNSNTLPALVVRYQRRMKPQQVYPCDVRWKSSPRGGAGGPLVVRLVMAGAQVVPSERTLDPDRPSDKALFYVTPLARGWLRGERVEVLRDGRKVQEIPLRSKVVTQRLTWALLVLTLVLPWLWQAHLREADVPGTQLERYLEKHAPNVPDFIEDKVPAVGDFRLGEFLESIPGHLKTNLDGLFGMARELHYFVLYLAGGLLLLTILSWFFHREKKNKKVGSPIPLPESDEEEAGAHAGRRGATAAEVIG
jgi:hypothetical protein